MIIHRGINKETAFTLNVKSGMLSYVDEDIAKYLEQLFGSKNGDWLIHSKQERMDMAGTKYVIVQLEDKDKDLHTIFFKINNV